MICPHCKKEISDALIAKHLAAKGGRKSKTTIPWSAQWKMQLGRFKHTRIETLEFSRLTTISATAIAKAKKEMPEVFDGKKVYAAHFLNRVMDWTTFEDPEEKCRIACLLLKEIKHSLKRRES